MARVRGALLALCMAAALLTACTAQQAQQEVDELQQDASEAGDAVESELNEAGDELQSDAEELSSDATDDEDDDY